MPTRARNLRARRLPETLSRYDVVSGRGRSFPAHFFGSHLRGGEQELTPRRTRRFAAGRSADERAFGRQSGVYPCDHEKVAEVDGIFETRGDNQAAFVGERGQLDTRRHAR